MRRIFVDTSALVALKDSGDRHHERALGAFEAHHAAQFVLTNYLVSEVHAYFCRTPAVALEYVDHLLGHPAFRVVRAMGRDERRALEILRGGRDKTYSYADAVSFAVMERLGLRTAFSFDRHFSQHGRWRVVPEGRL